MAKRSPLDTVALDIQGNALEGIEITVYEEDGTTPATIYGSKGGGSVTNPYETPETGLVQIWFEPGEYVLEWHDPELPARISDRTTYFEAVSGDSAGIDGAQIEDEGISNQQLGSNSALASEIGTLPFCELTNAADQSVAASTYAAITFDTEVSDTDTMHAGANPSRITATTAGVYICSAHVQFAEVIADGTEVELAIRKNGVGGTMYGWEKLTTGAGAKRPWLATTWPINLAASDYVEVVPYHEAGSAKDIEGGAVGSRFSVYWLGEG